MLKKSDKTFWITNISNKNVMLSDLNLMIKAMTSINLLDSKHYYLTEEQLNKSLTTGSLFKKRDKIVKRLVPPPEVKGNFIKMDTAASIPSRQRSIMEIKIEEHEELKLSDNEEEALKQEFEAIAETSDTVEYDRQPLIPKK